MASYSLSREAKNGINDILIFIAEDDVDAVAPFYDQLEDILTMLGENPMAGREIGYPRMVPILSIPQLSRFLSDLGRQCHHHSYAPFGEGHR